MLSKILETITGLEDLERVADKRNTDQLNAYLKTRTVWLPVKPTRFLDAATCTEQELLGLLEKGAHDMAGDPLEPWILELDGEKVLPVFSSQKRMQTFSAKISQDMNKIFSLGGAEVILTNVLGDLKVDTVVLNLFCKKRWSLDVRKS